MKKYLILIAFGFSTHAAQADCSKNSAAAAMALESINSQKRSTLLKVIDNQILGSSMISTGFLDKYQVIVAHEASGKKGYYQMWIRRDSCVVIETKKVTPFSYRTRQ